MIYISLLPYPLSSRNPRSRASPTGSAFAFLRHSWGREAVPGTGASPVRRRRTRGKKKKAEKRRGNIVAEATAVVLVAATFFCGV